MSTRLRLLPVLLVPAALSLLVAMWTGLFRAGWALPQLQSHHPLTHGPLLICGFLGTVIGLEKARGLGCRWAYLAPLFSGIGALAMIVSPYPVVAGTFFTAASVLLSLAVVDLARRHLDVANLLIVAGSLAWVVGNLTWSAGRSIPLAVSWWLAFPILIIVGERLELTRVLPRSRPVQVELLVELSVYAVGLSLTFWTLDGAFRLQGLGLVLIAAWLLRHDLARRTVRSGGVYRYTAICLLAGFAWLAVAGALLALWGWNLLGLRYDTMLHTILLGFVFGMIFGHVPIIAPMLLGRQLAFDRVMYAPVVLLHASLILRVAGSLTDWLPGRTLGSALNVAALLLFLVTTARAFRRGRTVAPSE